MELPTLTDSQKKRYNMFRREGMNAERAIVLATKNSDSPYNPALTRGVDKIFFGENSLASGVAGGVKEIFTGGRRRIEADKKIFESQLDPSIDPDTNGTRARLGEEYAKNKAPLSYGAAFGNGLGKIIGSGLETLDDLTGEVVSDAAMPVIDSALESDAGQYMLNKANEFNEENDGAPADILDLVSLGAVSQIPKIASASAIKNSVLRSGAAASNVAGGAARNTGRLMDYLKPAARTNPAAPIDESLQGIQRILETKLDQTQVLGSLDEIKEILRSNPDGLSESIFAKIDDIDLTPEQRTELEGFLKTAEDFMKQEDAPSIVENYLNGVFDKVEDASGAATSVIGNLSDNVFDRGLDVVRAVKEVPEKISERAKQAVSSRIVRVTKNDPGTAIQSVVDLYKKAVVPGVKKKNKTTANIKSIDEAIKRAVPDLAKKYDVEDLDDFATAIAAEKKAIFAKIEAGLDDATGNGKSISMQAVLDDLSVLSKSELAEFSPELRAAIDRTTKILANEVDGELIAKSISPSGAQELIAQLNQSLSPNYRGARNGADDTIDLVLVEKLRTLTDEVVDDLGDGSFKDLKREYGDLKSMEDDVVHRAIFEKQRGGRLSDLSDIGSFADVAAGSLDPAFLTRGVAQFMSKEVINSLTDKNELVRQMFLYGKNLPDTRPKQSAPAPKTPTPDPEKKQSIGDGFGVSRQSEIYESLGEEVLLSKVDYTKPLAIEGETLNLFGSSVNLTKLEADILKKAGLEFEVGHAKTKTGRKKAKQPQAAYVVTGDGKKSIRFTPLEGKTMERTIQTAFHEVGHAVDSNFGAGSLRNQKEIFAAMKKNGADLVRERAERAFASTIKKFDLDDDQINQLLRGQKIDLGNGRYLAGQKKLANYFRGFDEIFAESYAMYRVNPERLQELAPEMFQALDNISL